MNSVAGINNQPSPRAELQREPGRHHRAHDDLTFRADVDHTRAERDADAQTDQQQRRGLDEGLGYAGDAAQRAFDQRAVSLKRIRAKQHQQDCTDDQRHDHGQQRQRHS